ncbi:MAG TPA: RNB domain-containing ribonuclease [Solirubrobacterales bacterium]|nr:RNB domain-containing ribonuclease [Solirubrobacterales bacterium]
MSRTATAVSTSGPAGRVGIVAKRGRLTVVEPFFERGTRMAVDVRRRRDVKIGDLVLVRPLRRARRGGGIEVVRSLGRPNIARDVVEALMYDRGHHRRFAGRVEDEAAAGAAEEREEPRRDLTALPTFTIDPATAKDYDDALSVERDGDSLRLYVHIADVAAFVRPGTALDGEAERRGNSVYVPGAVEPMLPHALSNEACSLVPGLPRPVITVEVLLGPDTRVRSTAFYRSTIRSDARLVYEDVDQVFAGRERAPEAVAEPLALAREVAAGLRDRRLARGALAVESSEPAFDFDEQGNVTAARDEIQTEAHWVIEHLMILANEQVAERLSAARVGTIYRVHEEPDPASVERLVAQLDSLDVPTPPLPEHLTPQQGGELVGEISRRVLDYQRATGRGGRALRSLVLRALKQAVYSETNIGHAGLASTAYCHFTSPIRRYPDLVVHRGLMSTLGAGEPPGNSLNEIAARSSETEREAAMLERDADDICLAFLLERTLAEAGWERGFEGEVTGVIESGAFVSFDRGDGGAPSEGYLPVRRMRGDYYDLSEERTMLVGRHTGRRLRLGDPLTVAVRSIDAPRGRVDLELPGGSGE